MNMQQAQQLAAEAQALCDRINASRSEAYKVGDYDVAVRFMRAWIHALNRYERRIDKWAVVVYGPGVER